MCELLTIDRLRNLFLSRSIISVRQLEFDGRGDKKFGTSACLEFKFEATSLLIGSSAYGDLHFALGTLEDEIDEHEDFAKNCFEILNVSEREPWRNVIGVELIYVDQQYNRHDNILLNMHFSNACEVAIEDTGAPSLFRNIQGWLR